MPNFTLNTQDTLVLEVYEATQQILAKFKIKEVMFLFESPSQNLKYNPKKDFFPLIIHFVSIDDNKKDTYLTHTIHWNDGSDDEYPIYDKNEEYYGFHDMKKYIKETFPKLFAKKNFFGIILPSNTIEQQYSKLTEKIQAIELNKTLKNKRKKQKIII